MGHFVELARDFNFPLEFENQDKNYKKLENKKPTPKPKAIEFLKTRGIGELVAAAYRITTRQDNENILVFPFYNELDELVFIKYRNTATGAKPKEFCEKDTMPILFGINKCAGFERLVLTEGQLDSLSLAQAGISNACSVPIGALGFTWIEPNFNWIAKFKTIVIFGDIDKNGEMTLVETLLRRLPNKILVVRKADYLGKKDANEILLAYGEKALITAVDGAEPPQLKKVKSLADVAAIDLNKLPKIATGIWELDKCIGGLYLGKMTILTGERGHGKSTLASLITANATEQGFKTFVYSGELTDYHFRNWIDSQFAGKNNVETVANEYGELETFLKTGVAEKLGNWYRDSVYLYDNSFTDDEAEDLPKLIETVVRQYDVKLIILDNLMTALDCSNGNDLNIAQTKFTNKLSKICKKHNVHIILIAHPRKTIGEINNDDVAGSGNITNLADLVISYARKPEDNADDSFDSKIIVTKNRTTGRLAKGDFALKLKYSPVTKRIVGKNDDGNKIYGWEKMASKSVAVDILEDLPF